MGMKYSFDARFELARRLSATFQRSAIEPFSPDQDGPPPFTVPVALGTHRHYLFREDEIQCRILGP